MQFLLPLIFVFLFLFLILKLSFFKGTFTGVQLAGLFFIKVLAGIAGHYLYTYYYPQSDASLYFEGSRNLFDQVFGNSDGTRITGWNSNYDDAFYNNSRVMIILNFFIQFLSFNNVFVHIVFFCFFSFTGITALYKSFFRHFPGSKRFLVIGLYLVPSVVFWSSGIYKEALAFFSVGFIIYLSDFGLAKSYSLKNGIVLLVLLVLLFFLKVYIVFCLLPLLLLNFIVSKTGGKNYLLKYASCFLVFIFVFHFFSKISERTNFYQLIADKQAKAISESEGGIFLANDQNFIRLDYADSANLILAYSEMLSGNTSQCMPDPETKREKVYSADSLFWVKRGSNYFSWELDNMKDTTFVKNSASPEEFKFLYKIKPANSRIQMKKMEPDFAGFLKRIPFAVATVFFQPALFNIKNALQLFSWLENMWLLLLVTLAILFFDKKVLEKKEILMFCLLFALFQFAMIGLTSPVVGAIVRYKSPALPFLFTICLLCTDWNKVSAKLIRKKV